jgi:hypothetical protein
MPEFHETVGGRKFYEGTMPSIATALVRISDQLQSIEKSISLLTKAIEPLAQPPSGFASGVSLTGASNRSDMPTYLTEQK